MDPKDLKSLEDLTEKQREFIRDHAYEIFAATMLPPNDKPESLVSSNCSCCKARRDIMKKILSLG